MSLAISPAQTTLFSKLANNAGAQQNNINTTTLKAVTATLSNVSMKTTSSASFSLVPPQATGAGTVFGYVPAAFSTSGSYFLNTSPSGPNAALAGSTGVAQIPNGAHITSITTMNPTTALAGGCTGLTYSYQSVASNAAAGTSTTTLIQASANTCWGAYSTNIVTFANMTGTTGTLPVAPLPVNAGSPAISGPQALVVQALGAVTVGNPILAISYHIA